MAADKKAPESYEAAACLCDWQRRAAMCGDVRYTLGLVEGAASVRRSLPETSCGPYVRPIPVCARRAKANKWQQSARIALVMKMAPISLPLESGTDVGRLKRDSARGSQARV